MLFDKRYGLVGHSSGSLQMTVLSQHRGGLGKHRNILPLMQLEGSLQPQDAQDSIVQSAGRQPAGFQAFLHESYILFQIFGEQKHIAAVLNRPGDQLISRQRDVHSRHCGRVGNNQPVEAEAFP
ncbi:hypothetical protein D3C73_1113100 [compost metagenome]